MYWTEACAFSWWWLLPVIMLFLCFFIMRGRLGTTMCGCGPRTDYRSHAENAESARDILDRRYAAGEIDTMEYEEKKRNIDKPTDSKLQ